MKKFECKRDKVVFKHRYVLNVLKLWINDPNIFIRLGVTRKKNERRSKTKNKQNKNAMQIG